MPDDKIRPDRPPRREDDEDDRPRRRRRRDEDDYDDDVRVRRRDDGLNTLIPYKNPQALTGYYLSVFSLIPCAGLFLGPAAFILGIFALRRRNRRPEAGGLAHAIVALVLGFLTSAANWGLVAFLVIAALMK